MTENDRLGGCLDEIGSVKILFFRHISTWNSRSLKSAYWASRSPSVQRDVPMVVRDTTREWATGLVGCLFLKVNRTQRSG